jgi:hypothetical protein
MVLVTVARVIPAATADAVAGAAGAETAALPSVAVC